MTARSAFVALVALVCLTCAAVAQTLTFPALTGRVVDEAGVLSPADRADLDNTLADLQARTTDQLVVVTLKSLQGTAIEEYGYQLGRNWHIGQKDKDSGVLLIVAPSEHAVRIEVGYGLEGVLTDAATKIIIDTAILPKFKAGDYPGGIKIGAADIIDALDAEAATAPASPTQAAVAADHRTAAIPVWLVIVLALAGVGLMIACAMTRGGGVCQAIMQLLFLLALSGRGGSSSDRGSFSGGGGSFGGGGSSGSW